MTTLFRRRIELSVDTLKINPELRIKGKVGKTYKPEPNTCEIQIYNLTPEHRAQLSRVKNPQVKLAAGYGDGSDGVMQLFYGHAIYVKHEVDNDGNVITTVSTTDGGEKKQKARVNVSFGRNTKTGTVLRRIVDALGLNPGNTAKVATILDSGATANIYLEGTMVSGSAADELSHLLRSCGYDWSIQDETIAIRKQGAAADGFAVALSPDSGLIESPSVSNKGVCSGTCLIFKAGAGLDLVPGRLINLKSKFVSGQFILAKTDFDFDNYSDPWYCAFEAVTRKGDFAKVS